MNLTAGMPASASVLTFFLPTSFFAVVVLWGFFQRRRR
jgi:hypothetical protein